MSEEPGTTGRAEEGHRMARETVKVNGQVLSLSVAGLNDYRTKRRLLAEAVTKIDQQMRLVYLERSMPPDEYVAWRDSAAGAKRHFSVGLATLRKNWVNWKARRQSSLLTDLTEEEAIIRSVLGFMNRCGAEHMGWSLSKDDQVLLDRIRDYLLDRGLIG